MTGTGSTSDITSVKVYIDANNNGAIDAGETVAGQGTIGSTGTAGVTLASALAVGGGVNLLVAVDIAATIQAGVSIPGAPWTLLLIIGLPLAVLLRRRAPAIAVAIITLAVAASLACGSGSNNDDTTGDNDQQTDTDTDGTDDDGDNDVNPQAKTYAFTVSAVTGTETVSGGPAVIASGVPLPGATISVMP